MEMAELQDVFVESAVGYSRIANRNAMVAAPRRAFDVAARTALGRFLDDERALARANCPLARARLCRSGIEPARRALLRPNGFVLDRSPPVQHMAGLLHGGLPSTFAHTAGSLRRASGSHNCRVFRLLSSLRPSLAMDTHLTIGRSGDCRLCVGYFFFRRATLRCTLALPFAGRAQRLSANAPTRSLFRSRCRRGACFRGRHSRRRSRVSGAMG